MVKLETWPPVGFGNVPSTLVHVIVVAPAPIRESISAPAVFEIDMTGVDERSPGGVAPATVPAKLPPELL